MTSNLMTGGGHVGGADVDQRFDELAQDGLLELLVARHQLFVAAVVAVDLRRRSRTRGPRLLRRRRPLFLPVLLFAVRRRRAIWQQCLPPPRGGRRADQRLAACFHSSEQGLPLSAAPLASCPARLLNGVGVRRYFHQMATMRRRCASR